MTLTTKGSLMLLLGVLALVPLLAACTDESGDAEASPDAEETEEPSLRTLDEEEGAAELAERGAEVTLIDVRTPAEHAEGHLVGADLIDWQGADFRDRVDELDRDGSYLLYCRTGNRSGQAARAMVEMGFTDVANIGGFDGLVRAGAEAQR